VVRHGVEQGPALSRRRAAAPELVSAAILVLLAILLVWNAFHFPWGRSYDAISFHDYVLALFDKHRLPLRTDTAVWHNPPLFFVIAGALTRGGKHLGIGQPERLVQLLSAACVFGVALLTRALAGELFPRRRWLPTLALLLAALTPVLVRAGALFHPDPLAAFLNTAGLYVVVRALARDALDLRTGALGGVLLSLGALTRTWGLAGAGAALAGLLVAWWWRRDPRLLRFLAAAAAAVALVVVPWLVVKQVRYGNALAYSQPNPAQWRHRGRNLAFYVDLAPAGVFSHPYDPHFRNRVVPIVYSDWWGDYWLDWRVRKKYAGGPLPASYTRPLTWQSVAGVGVTLAALAGVVALAVRALRRRDAALIVLLLSLAFLAASFLGFLVRYPKEDGDNIKALYVLDGAPVVALGAAFALAWLWRRRPVGPILTTAALALLAVPSISFLILRSRH
jgi:4-amino-4-deoxy-L-arabinose transferase-like glycosyltransferase